jgi:hypothetical protein
MAAAIRAAVALKRRSDGALPLSGSVASLHQDAVAEAGGAWHGTGSHLRIPLAGALAGHGRDGAEATLLLGIAGEVLIHHKQVAAIGEAQKHCQRERAPAGQHRLEIDPVAAAGAIDGEIRVPGDTTHQPIGADALLHRRYAATTDGHQGTALSLGGPAGTGQTSCQQGLEGGVFWAMQRSGQPWRGRPAGNPEATSRCIRPEHVLQSSGEALILVSDRKANRSMRNCVVSTECQGSLPTRLSSLHIV